MRTIRSASDVIERIAGARPITCPWRTYEDPLVADVIHLRSKAKAKALTTRRDIPQRTLDALAAFESAMNACRHEKHALDRKKRDAENNKNKAKR